MEKLMTVEEKMRRAEEIYNRRNGINVEYESKKKEEKKVSFLHKMIKQIIICFIIYGIFYVVTNREYFLSEDFQSKVQEVVSQNENLNHYYNLFMEYINKYLENNENQDSDTNIEEQIDTNETTIENVNEEDEQTEINEENEQDEISEESIGGANENVEESEKTQEEQDAEEIKNTISFIIPVEGTISSKFGWRTPTTSTVPKYHTGIDIAATTGTIIKSATDGIVILASSEGDYGNHYKIQIDDVTIIYAHCNKLYLSEGDTITQGQEIAEVGSTGNSTGPHLHFEIRKQDRLVDPQLILDF